MRAREVNSNKVERSHHRQQNCYRRVAHSHTKLIPHRPQSGTRASQLHLYIHCRSQIAAISPPPMLMGPAQNQPTVFDQHNSNYLSTSRQLHFVYSLPAQLSWMMSNKLKWTVADHQQSLCLYCSRTVKSLHRWPRHGPSARAFYLQSAPRLSTDFDR